MQLNALGRATMNNPARRALRRHVLLPALTRVAGGALEGAVLEIGPGDLLGAAT